MSTVALGSRFRRPLGALRARAVPASQRTAASRALVLTGVAVMLPGLLLTAFVGFLALGSQLEAHRSQQLLSDTFRTQLHDGVAPTAGLVAAGAPVAVLDIPRLGLHQVVVNGSSSRQTATGPGLARDTALPGQAGVSLVVGRRATYGAPFRHLGDLRPGDVLRVRTGAGVARFVVDLVRTSNAPAQQVAVVPSRLTLVTSDPALSPDRTLMVSAALQGKPLPGALSHVSVADNAAGQHSTDGAIGLLLWAQLLLAVALAATWAAQKFRSRAVWLGAVPLVLAIVWHVFESVSVLLPNTL